MAPARGVPMATLLLEAGMRTEIMVEMELKSARNPVGHTCRACLLIASTQESDVPEGW